MLWKYCKNIVNITLFKWPKYIPFFLFPFLLFFLPFFSTVWLIDLSPPPFIILHLYLSFFPFKNFTFPMPSCLHVSSGNSFSFLMNTLLSFFFTNLLSPHKTLPLLLLSLTHGNNHGFFFWVKNSWRVLHCHRAVATPFSSFFFFWSIKISQSTHCQKEIFTWNYPEHWCEFNVWQNVMVEASTMVIWCCECNAFIF